MSASRGAPSTFSANDFDAGYPALERIAMPDAGFSVGAAEADDLAYRRNQPQHGGDPHQPEPTRRALETALAA